MLVRTEELTALFETLDVLSCALMACLSRGWRTAMNEARTQIASVGAIDRCWLHRQLPFWAKRHHMRVEYFSSNFTMSVLPRFYTGLRKLRLGHLDEATASSHSLAVDHRFPAADEALARVTSQLRVMSQLRELVVDPEISNFSLTIIAGNCSNLQKLKFSSGQISDVGLALLAQGCKQLEHLDIRVHDRQQLEEFTHEGVVAIARSCRRLKTLRLANSSKVEDPALVALGQHCPLLRSLRGSGWNRITDAAVAALVHGCPQLEVVELSHAARITDASASALAQGCPNLSTLDLYGTGVTAAGVLTLAKHAKQKLTIDTHCVVESAARALEREYPVELAALIDIKVLTHGNWEILFTMRELQPLQKLMHTFCKRQGVSMNSVSFRFDGDRITETQTPKQLGMEDGDIIHVHALTDFSAAVLGNLGILGILGNLG